MTLAHLIQQLGAAGAAIVLEGAVLILEHDGELGADILAAIRHQKPALLLRLQEERDAYVGLWCESARRFLGAGVGCDVAELHKLYLVQVQATYAGDVLRFEAVGLGAFTLAFRAAAPAPQAAAPARRGATAARHSDRARARRATARAGKGAAA